MMHSPVAGAAKRHDVGLVIEAAVSQGDIVVVF
jgi:hypothetical protein